MTKKQIIEEFGKYNGMYVPDGNKFEKETGLYIDKYGGGETFIDYENGFGEPTLCSGRYGGENNFRRLTSFTKNQLEVLLTQFKTQETRSRDE